ncbi:hypothetical protein GOP47_0024140 [Adiantum capillus-veneris]|uniref:Uncharacterized protein n=1 Tax=Adiantum capillus-veneris TaxID=13818 RepID=A0A9D4U5U5_ADICA|nr:hypothetical protein GOP47_0024140 [Adiantum capillus-veneris]
MARDFHHHNQWPILPCRVMGEGFDRGRMEETSRINFLFRQCEMGLGVMELQFGRHALHSLRACQCRCAHQKWESRLRAKRATGTGRGGGSSYNSIIDVGGGTFSVARKL